MVRWTSLSGRVFGVAALSMQRHRRWAWMCLLGHGLGEQLERSRRIWESACGTLGHVLGEHVCVLASDEAKQLCWRKICRACCTGMSGSSGTGSTGEIILMSTTVCTNTITLASRKSTDDLHDVRENASKRN